MYEITGPDQQQKQKGTDLMKNHYFKDEFGRFLMEELQKQQYEPTVGNHIPILRWNVHKIAELVRTDGSYSP